MDDTDNAEDPENHQVDTGGPPTDGAGPPQHVSAVDVGVTRKNTGEPAGDHTATPDVRLDVPSLHLDEVDLQVEDLTAHVALNAEVLDLLKLSVGADVRLGAVRLGLTGVEAQAELDVRLGHVAAIIERVLTTIDRNPEILRQVARGAVTAVEEAGRGAGRVLDEAGEDVGTAIEATGRATGQAVETTGRVAERATETAEGAVDQAADEVTEVAERAPARAREVTEPASPWTEDDHPPARNGQRPASRGRPRRPAVRGASNGHGHHRRAPRGHPRSHP